MASPHRIIRASAGTGKTYRLTRHFVRLLCTGDLAQHPERICAMTFTRAAAGEIRDRLLQTLAEAVLDKKAFDALKSDLPDHITQNHLEQVLLDLLARLGRIRVSTLDSFFIQLAQAFSFDLDMPLDWSIANEVELEELTERAVASLWDAEHLSDIKTMLFELHRRANRSDLTKAIVEVVKEAYGLVRETDREAWTWFPRPRLLTSSQLQDAIAALERTPFHGTASFDKARLKDAEKAKSQDWRAFLKAGVAKKVFNGEPTYISNNNLITDEIIDLYAPLIEHAGQTILLETASSTHQYRQLTERYAMQLAALRLTNPCYGFDDITFRLRVANVLGRLEAMYFKLDGAIDHLLIDEFQDTSLQQWLVLRPLAREVAASSQGSDRSFMCVGDPKQSLYSFRGGRSELLEVLPDELPALADAVESMDISYRSCPVVLDVVNQVFEDIARNPALASVDAAIAAAKKWQEQHFSQHTSAPSLRDQRGLVQLVTSAQEQTTAEKAADLVRQAVKAAPSATIGVLFRSNSKGEIASFIDDLWTGDQPIAASERGGNPLTDSVAVTLVTSLLSMIDQPGSTTARFHVLNSPLHKEVIGDVADEEQALSGWIAKARSTLTEEGYAQSVRKWSESMAPYLDGHDQLRMSQLLRFLTDDIFEPGMRPSDVVRHIEKTKISNPRTAHVQAMTIHASKGLQFDIVILPDLDSALVRRASLMTENDDPLAAPTRVSIGLSRELCPIDETLNEMYASTYGHAISDALCVLYVAMTRSRYELHIVLEPTKLSKKKAGSTNADVLLCALTGDFHAPADSVVYQHPMPVEKIMMAGQATAENIGGRLQDPKEPDVSGHPVQTARVRLSETAQYRRGLASVSPSELEGSTVVQGNQVLQPRRSATLDRGTAMHEWLSDIEWFETAPTQSQLLARLDDHHIGPGLLNKWANEFLEMLRQPKLQALLAMPSGQSKATSLVRNEQPFAVKVPAGTNFAHRTIRLENQLSGIIDRLIVGREGEQIVSAHVIDYKTDFIDEENPEAVDLLVHRYAPQLAGYRFAASKLLSIDVSCIDTSLMLLHRDLHVPVDVDRFATES